MRNVATLCALAGLMGCQPADEVADEASTMALEQAGPTPIYMTIKDLRVGDDVTLTAEGPERAMVYFFVGAQADGGGPCASPTVCVDVGPSPYLLGAARVTSDGVATLTVPGSTTATLTDGDTWYFQAAGRLQTRHNVFYNTSLVIEGTVGDVDGDGYFAGEDCDDDDASVNPGATETDGDGVDQDCDGYDDVDELPVISFVRLLPQWPDTTDTHSVEIELNHGEPNPTPVVYSYQWLVNGVEVSQAPTLDPSFTRRDDVVSVRVRADDGRGSAEYLTEVVYIEDADPVVTSCEATPTTADAFTALQASSTATDADNDPLTLTYQWEVYTFPVYVPIFGATGSTLASCVDRGTWGTDLAANCAPGSRVRVVCTAMDGPWNASEPLPSADVAF